MEDSVTARLNFVPPNLPPRIETTTIQNVANAPTAQYRPQLADDGRTACFGPS